VRRIEDDAAWVPRVFDPDEPGSIDMWLGPTRRVSSQPQLREETTDTERNRDGVAQRHPETVGGGVS
jgi:2,3-dihydroxy-p-cumate/2,3-dihydroxybenzoate 3,4-dioxygenase